MTVKLTISLPDHLADEARAAVRSGLAPSVSAYIAAAMEKYGNAPTLTEFLDEWEAETGPVPPKIQAWADAQLAGIGAHVGHPESA